MFIFGSPNEINDVAQSLNPKYPRQNLESIQNDECFYVINEVPVTIRLIPNGSEEEFTACANELLKVIEKIRKENMEEIKDAPA